MEYVAAITSFHSKQHTIDQHCPFHACTGCHLISLFCAVRVFAAFAAVLVIVLYSLLKYAHTQCAGSSTLAMKQNITGYLRHKAATVLTTLFCSGSIFFVRSMLRPFACEEDSNGSGEKFMVSSPDIQCSTDDPSYVNLVRLVQGGLVGYFLCYAVLWALLVRAQRSATPGLSYFAFMGDKYETRTCEPWPLFGSLALPHSRRSAVSPSLAVVSTLACRTDD
eukprot:COSAG02_NODE_282_length_25773_cov_1666.149762_2_plen_222_part_00